MTDAQEDVLWFAAIYVAVWLFVALLRNKKED